MHIEGRLKARSILFSGVMSQKDTIENLVVMGASDRSIVAFKKVINDGFDEAVSTFIDRVFKENVELEVAVDQATVACLSFLVALIPLGKVALHHSKHIIFEAEVRSVLDGWVDSLNGLISEVSDESWEFGRDEDSGDEGGVHDDLAGGEEGAVSETLPPKKKVKPIVH